MGWGLISEMGHVALQTTRLGESAEVAGGLFGLRDTESDARRSYFAATEAHHEVVYIASDVDAVDHLGLVARDKQALVELRERIQRRGYPVVSEGPLEAGIGDGFSFVGPEGFVFEIYTSMAPAGPLVPTFGPQRYGHINLHPTDIETMKAFLVDVLEFRVSDVIGDGFAYFLRCNADHHGIALITGRGTLHHHAWQTKQIGDLGDLADRLDRVGRHLIWGPVRHGAGHNIAAYYVEPSGAVVELYTDLEKI